MNDIVIKQPDPAEHERSGGLLVSQANEVVVTNLDDREHAGMFLNQINATIKAIEMEFDGSDETPGPVALAYRAWKSGVSLRDRALASFKAAKSIIDGKIKRFEYETEQKRIAEARKAEAIARQKAEEERARAIAEAKKLGDREAVDNLKEAPISVVAAAPKTPEIPKTEGMRRSAPVWDFDITDENKIPARFKMVDEKAIRAIVNQLGPKHGIPGITVFDSRSRG